MLPKFTVDVHRGKGPVLKWYNAKRMTFITPLARFIIRNILSIGDMDLRSVRWRLEKYGARHSLVSGVISADDSPGRPSEKLLDLVPALIAGSRNARLPLFAGRGAPEFAEVWPGEHYRLLSALVQELQPKLVLDVGTYTGLSALSMLPALPQGGRIVTVDVTPWQRIPGTHLRDADFSDGKLSQIVCDLGEAKTAAMHGDLIRNADLVFIDAPKDGVFERSFLSNLAAIGLRQGALLVFDDIRLWNMLEIWREIEHPKLDITSFGHFCGTGLVDWRGSSHS